MCLIQIRCIRLKKEVPSLSLNCDELVEDNTRFIPDENEKPNNNESIIRLKTFDDLDLHLDILSENESSSNKFENLKFGDNLVEIKPIYNNVKFV